MPVIDQHFKYLLAAGLQRNISLRKIIVVNPALRPDNPDRRAALLARIFEIFKQEMYTRGRIDIIDATAAMAFFNPDTRKKLSRNLPKGLDPHQRTFFDG